VYYERSKDEKIDRKKTKKPKKPRENEILNNQFHEDFFLHHINFLYHDVITGMHHRLSLSYEKKSQEKC